MKPLSRPNIAKGVWTIGVGHTKPAGDPDPKTYDKVMPLKEVFKLFQADVHKYADAVNAALKVRVSQTVFDALVSFHFNTGGLDKASLTKFINAGDKKTAAKQFLNWKKPPDVMGRRRQEQNSLPRESIPTAARPRLPWRCAREGTVEEGQDHRPRQGTR